MNVQLFDHPIPVIDSESQPFWAAVQKGELLIDRCVGCERFVFYHRPMCLHCGSSALVPHVAGGTGEVYSYTISRRPASAEFRDDVPYIVAIVELDEGVRLMTNIVNCAPGEVHIGQRVSLRCHPLTPEISLPLFEPMKATQLE